MLVVEEVEVDELEELELLDELEVLLVEVEELDEEVLLVLLVEGLSRLYAKLCNSSINQMLPCESLKYFAFSTLYLRIVKFKNFIIPPLAS